MAFHCNNTADIISLVIVCTASQVCFYHSAITLSDININLLIPGTPATGNSFTITCKITVPDDRLSRLPTVFWYPDSSTSTPFNGQGEKVVENKMFGDPVKNKSHVTATLVFSPLKTSDARQYYCAALFDHPISLFPSGGGTVTVTSE